MGDMVACDKVCPGVVFTSSLLSSHRNGLVDKLPGEGVMTIELLLEDLSLGR